MDAGSVTEYIEYLISNEVEQINKKLNSKIKKVQDDIRQIDEKLNNGGERFCKIQNDLRDMLARHECTLRKMEDVWFMSVVKGQNLRELAKRVIGADAFNDTKRWSLPLSDVISYDFGDAEIISRFCDWCCEHKVTFCVERREIYQHGAYHVPQWTAAISGKHNKHQNIEELLSQPLYPTRLVDATNNPTNCYQLHE